MKARIIFPTMFTAILCTFTSTQAADTNTAAASSNPVIAQGKDFEIRRGELDEAMASVRAQNQTLSPEQLIQDETQLLTVLINQKLLLAKATDEDKATVQKETDLQMTALEEQYGSQEALEQKLKTAGTTLADVRSQITRRITESVVFQRELKISVSDDDIKKFYDDHRISAFETPEMVRVSHILVFTVDPVTLAALPSDQQMAQRTVVDDLVKNIRAGVDFRALAKQFSEDPGSRAGGGELPPFPRGQMAPEIDAAAFSLTNNQISGVITTSTGYQIIKLLEKIPASTMSYLVAAPKIKDLLTQQQIQKLAPPYLEGLRAAAGVKILDPNLQASPATTAGAPPNP